MTNAFRIVLAWMFFAVAPIWADTATITIDASRAGPRINPRMYGIFLEEINHGVDGGLYAELVRNRAFEDGRPPEGYALRDGRWVDERGFNSGYEQYGYEVDGLPFWSLVQCGGAKGAMRLDKTGGVSEESSYCLELNVEEVGDGYVGVANEGFFGIGVEKGKQYRLSLYARRGETFTGSVSAWLEDADGSPCSDKASFELADGPWQHYEGLLTASHSQPRARLVVAAGSTGVVWLDFVSLFPAGTWKGRSNGLRPDIAQMIADLKPGFVRFPGGCVVEGGTVESSYNWKRTVGPLEGRQEQWGP